MWPEVLVLQRKVVMVINGTCDCARDARSVRAVARGIEMLDLATQNHFHFHELHFRGGCLVNKSELVDRVANATGVAKRTAESAVDAVLDAIVETTRAGG